jgi:hypothetical protein
MTTLKQPHFSLLFSALGSRLLSVEAREAEVSMSTAPKFEPITIFRPNENVLSDLIQLLLDPKGEHGQKDLFLKELLHICRVPFKMDTSHAKVFRERCTTRLDRKRRIDILVDGGTCAIAIENKPWAPYGENQLPDYCLNLHRKYGRNFILIALEGYPERSAAPPSTKQIRLWRYYVHLRTWLGACSNLCKAPSVTAFLTHFLQYLESIFSPTLHMPQKSNLQELELLLKQQPNLTRTAAVVAELFPNIRARFIEALFVDLENFLKTKLGKDWKIERPQSNFLMTKWARFSLSRLTWKNGRCLSLESQPENGYVVLGIWRPDPKLPKRPELREKLREHDYGDMAGGSYWEGQSSFKRPFHDWYSAEGFMELYENRQTALEQLGRSFLNLAKAFKTDLIKP